MVNDKNFTEIARWVWFAFCLFVLVGEARAGVFRRIWNWPMRIGVACWLLFALLGWLGDWATHRHIIGGAVIVLRDAGFVLFAIGFVSIFIFLAVFLVTILRDFRTPSVPNMAPIDSVQDLILHGRETEAIDVYQKQMEAGQEEAVEAVGQIAASLKAGLRV